MVFIFSSSRQYFRCDIKTEPEQVCMMLSGVWGMAVPGLIMRMIGDIDTTPSVKIEKERLQGISDAAVASGMSKYRKRNSYENVVRI
jgi:hypothetical protein